MTAPAARTSSGSDHDRTTFRHVRRSRTDGVVPARQNVLAFLGTTAKSEMILMARAQSALLLAAAYLDGLLSQ